MTKEELKELKSSIYQPICIYADKEGIIAHIDTNLCKQHAYREFDVRVGSVGFVENFGETSMRIRWDHYDFEDHTKQELLPNPITEFNYENLDMLRVNKYPPNVRLI